MTAFLWVSVGDGLDLRRGFPNVSCSNRNVGIELAGRAQYRICQVADVFRPGALLFADFFLDAVPCLRRDVLGSVDEIRRKIFFVRACSPRE